MWCAPPDRSPVDAVARSVGIAMIVGLAWCPIGGCSSPSRGPETDVVEVERIDLVPRDPTSPRAEPGEDVPAAPAAE